MKQIRMDRRNLLLSAGVVLIGAGLSPAFARKPEIYLDQGGLFGNGWDYAVGGFDVVSYFNLSETDGPVEGKNEIATQYKGVSWRFSTQDNLERFMAEPDRYRPQYGGYCAWAMARKKLAKGDPEVWYVYGGKLYLNVSNRYQREWLSDLDGDIARGDANWPGILDDDKT